MIHIFPINDEQEHITDGPGCPCQPVIQYHDPDTGELMPEALTIHSSFDGRELVEQAEEIWRNTT